MKLNITFKTITGNDENNTKNLKLIEDNKEKK